MEKEQKAITGKDLKLHSDFQNIWGNLNFSKGYLKNEEILNETVIFFVIKGRVRFSINEMKNYVIYSDEMFLVPQGCSCDIEILESTNIMTCQFHVESLLLEQALIDELIPYCVDIEDDFIKLSTNKVIKSYLILLNKYIKDGLDSYYFFDLKRQEIFLLLFFYYTKKELARFLSGIIGENVQFRKFVMNNYLNVKNVQELAALANYSTSGFIKKFQRNFNESPYRWMQKQKAKRILAEINQGIKSLQEIATEYNFSSYQHFATFCKSHFGSPPTEIFDKYILKNNT